MQSHASACSHPSDHSAGEPNDLHEPADESAIAGVGHGVLSPAEAVPAISVPLPTAAVPVAAAPTAMQPLPLSHLPAPLLGSLLPLRTDAEAPLSSASSDDGDSSGAQPEAIQEFVGPAPDLYLGDGDEFVAASEDEIMQGADDADAEPASPHAAAAAVAAGAAAVAAAAAHPARLVDVVAAAPRKGSGAWLRERRRDPIAEGSSKSILQAAYTIAELKAQGVSNAACDLACQNVCGVLDSFEHVDEQHHPKSLHMVRAVLGVEDAEKYEFGWCEKCGERFANGAREGDAPEPSIADTCLRCGHTKYKVRPLSCTPCLTGSPSC